MKRETFSAEGRERYDAIAQSLVAGGSAEASRMFGMPTLKKGGKAFAGYYSGSMTFKLRGPAHTQALEPGPVAGGGQSGSVEEAVVEDVDLTLPAAGDGRHASHAVGLPVAQGEGDLDPER